MKRKLFFIGLLLFVFMAACVQAETLYVDNHDGENGQLRRLNMRSGATASDPVIASYYSGSAVTVVETPQAQNAEATPEEASAPAPENNDYVHVEIGGISGYMASRFLITESEAKAKYPDGSAFWDGAPADVDLAGMWETEIPLYSSNNIKSEKLASIPAGERVKLRGITGTWAYVTRSMEGIEQNGYVPLDRLTETGAAKAFILFTGEDQKTISLYETPSLKGKSLLEVESGTTCLSLFGRGEGNWRRVRIGGVTGWLNLTKESTTTDIGDRLRTSVPYYPQIMMARVDTLLYKNKGNKDTPYITLGFDMHVERLGTSGDYSYVRTLEGGLGNFDSGDYGYVLTEDLIPSPNTMTVGVVQVDDQDMPDVVYTVTDGTRTIKGALVSGAQIRLIAYTQTEFAEVSIGKISGYIKKSGLRVISEGGNVPSNTIPQRGTMLEDTVLYAMPDSKQSTEVSIAKGSRVYMLGKFGDWAFINAGSQPDLDLNSDDNDLLGFVPLSAVDAPVSTTHLLAHTTKDKVNMRSAGNRTGNIIGIANQAELLRVTDYGTTWTGVVKPDGTRGYINNEFLRFE